MQFQIAEAYRRIGDLDQAKAAYRLCLAYQQFVSQPPSQQAELSILAVVENARKKLESLR